MRPSRCLLLLRLKNHRLVKLFDLLFHLLVIPINVIEWGPLLKFFFVVHLIAVQMLIIQLIN